MARRLHSGSNDLETIVFERRSIRGYKNQAVPRDVLEDVIRIAQRAPSTMNTQPWHFHVLTGENPLDRVRQGNTEKMMAGSAIDREITLNHGYEGPHRDRQVEIAIQLLRSDGDRPRRQGPALGLGDAGFPPVRCAGLRRHHR